MMLERERMNMILMIFTNQHQNMRKENRKELGIADKGAFKSITFITDDGNEDISYADRTCNEHSLSLIHI